MESKKPLQVWLEGKLFARLKSKAAKKNKTISEVIRGLVIEWLRGP